MAQEIHFRIAWVALVVMSWAFARAAEEPQAWTYRGADGAELQLTGRLVAVRNGEAVFIDAAEKTVRVPLDGFDETLRKRILIDRVGAGVLFLEAHDGTGDPIGIGSGFVVAPSGLFITNYHVIRGAASLEVSFRDSQDKVKVERCVAADRKNDLAVLSLEGKLPAGIQVVEIAEAAPLQAGTTVWTIGHPGGLKDTASWGDVNATRPTTGLPDGIRQLLAAPDDTVWIQTDAVLAQGSSGGPLLNTMGQVVGINTWIAGPSLGFAVEAKQAGTLMANAEAGNSQPLPLAPDDDEPAMQWTSLQVNTLLQELKTQAQQQLASLPPQQRASAAAELLSAQRSKFLELAKAEQQPWPRFQSLVLVCQFAQATQAKPDALVDEACQQLATQYADSQWMSEAIAVLQQIQSNAVRRLLRQCYTKSPHETVRATAAVALTVNLLVYLTQSDLLSSATISATRQYIEQLLADLEKTYSKIEGVTEQVASLRMLFAGCKIGLEPQTIRGVDIEGKTFALDEFRGRVIVLDFFADWCPYCKQMYPHERELVEKYKDKPFMLLGINTENQSKLAQLVNDKQVTWRTWADGESGPIAQSWEVSSYPTLFVIDRNWKIRKIFEGNPGDQLDKAIEILLAEGQ